MLLLRNRFCGEGGIRTRDTLLEYTHFPGAPLQPLEHLSLVMLCPLLHSRLSYIYNFGLPSATVSRQRHLLQNERGCFHKPLVVHSGLMSESLGGERGIRTPGTVIPYVSLANWWFKPLTHLSRMDFFHFAIANIVH